MIRVTNLHPALQTLTVFFFCCCFSPGNPMSATFGSLPRSDFLTSLMPKGKNNKIKKICDNLEFRLRLQTHYSKPCDFAHWCHRFLHTPQTSTWPSHLTKKVPPISQTDLWALRAPLLGYGVIKTFQSIATACCHTFMCAHTHCWYPQVFVLFCLIRHSTLPQSLEAAISEKLQISNHMYISFILAQP